MKTTLNIIIATALVAVATTVSAKSWRINNNAAAAPNFTSINAAMSSADVTAGDTLYLDPGTSLSENQTVSKQVTIVGPGYFRGDTPHAFAYIQGCLYINAASTKVEGVIMLSDIRIKAPNVTIERCKFTMIEVGDDRANAQNCTIRQCYGERIEGQGASYNGYNYHLCSSYCTVENCILISSAGWGCIYDLYTPTIRHNYLKETENSAVLYSLDNAIIQANIMLNTKTSTNLLSNVNNISNISQNVMSCAETTYSSVPTDVNKFGNTSEAGIFTLTGMNDLRYQLKDDSPAKGYASDGGDCGPYGGLTPYVAGGLPNGYPYYTKAIIPAKSKDGKVNVSLKIKTQNE